MATAVQLVLAYAAIAVLFFIVVRSQALAERQRAKRMRLLAYALELRDVVNSSALLAHRFEHAMALEPAFDRVTLERWRDDGVR